MSGDPHGGGANRRRRTPEQAQREIIDAAEALLRERPYRELTVEEVMRRTELSRPSFYVYFRDRHDLVLRITEHLNDEMLPVVSDWLTASNGGSDLIRQALSGAREVYDRHAPVLRALADAAADDPDVEQAFGALMDSYIERTAAHARDEIDAGTISGIDPDETAKALIWMTERYLYYCFAGDQPVTGERVVDTLTTIWSRTLYLNA